MPQNLTEKDNPNTLNIDQIPIPEVLELINREDQKVARAVKKALPEISTAIERIILKLKSGGRLFYVGTGTSGRLGVLDASEIPPTFGVSNELIQGIIAGGFDALHSAVEASEDDTEAG
jgi:N-acetylmuramic acid 6-phosphate etherase